MESQSHLRVQRLIVILVLTAVVIALAWIGYLWYPKTKIDRASSSPCGAKCGKRRWAVKTLSDQAVTCIDFTPRSTTVSWLGSQPAPEPFSELRSGPIECQVWKLTAKLVGFKLENDKDFHVVLEDLNDPGTTIIVELPDPSCSGVCASIREKEIEHARENFIQALGSPSTQYRRVNETLIATVTGVGFFDSDHEKTGGASNGVELHPVIAFEIMRTTP